MDYGQAVWADCARTKSYHFNGELRVPTDTICVCQGCALPPPDPPKPSFGAKLKRFLTCSCFSDPDPVPPIPPNAQLQCALDSPLARNTAPGCPVALGLTDPKLAKQHLKETERLTKVNEKVYKARMASLAAEKKRKEKAEAEEMKRKAAEAAAKVAMEAAKKAAEEKAKAEMEKFQAWALRNGCTATTGPPNAPHAHHPHAHAHAHINIVPPCSGSTFLAVPGPAEYGLRRDPFVDQWGNQWPLMSNAMIHAVRQQNREDMLLGIANGHIHCR